ncbi:phosphatase PAP2 family protein [Metabacillus iocasae]|uniref:Undecaprenyl-diphosphatase n=1 Tax=Priestia iocasae TaxID=2291674 RepID=A0ABS2QUK3_9BACI|nr:phosphatase PAP2 family protein [Metabacillus iocasae]MBM7703168.1 undecaprenyl-diphosphatase [Metabacillus iocasae]
MKKQMMLVLSSLFVFLLIVFIHKAPWLEVFDRQVLKGVFELRKAWLTPIMVFFTEVGSWYLTAPIWFGLIIYLLYKREAVAVAFITLVYFGSRSLNWLLKDLFERPRPQLDQLIEASHYSFPSGHAMNSMAFYGGLILLINVFVPEQNRAKTVIHLLLLVLISMIGFSRMYLGVHYFTDVVAGFAAGIVWLFSVFILWERMLRKKKGVERG